MLLKSIGLLCLVGICYGVLHDVYTGEPLSEKQIKSYKAANLLKTCAVDIKPCDPNEGRRIDGSCNNLKHPGRGVFNAPQRRVRAAYFHNGIYERKAKSGKPLPATRTVRLTMVKSGKSSHHDWNHNVPGYVAFLYNEGGSVHDAENMLLGKTDCCKADHMNDFECTPNIISEDDPVHRFSGIRCMNSTRPITHQSLKCTDDPVPSPIQNATASIDNSFIYNHKGRGDSAIRTFKNGELIMEEEDGKLFPPNGPTAHCPNNAKNETRCFEDYNNTLPPVTLFTIWFVRLHNFVANQLAKFNPHWDDEKLFQVSRDINIAYAQQLYIYGVLEAMIDRDYLDEVGITVKDGGFREDYDDTKWPMASIEYNLAIRWFHLVQESTAKFFDKDGNFIQDHPLFESIFATGFFARDNNMEYFTQSTFRAPCRAYDHSVDLENADRGFPHVQLTIDTTAGDLNKNRNFGLAPYIEYVKYFTGRNITSFDDLSFLISKEYIYLLKNVYEDVSDIDLLAGLWVEDIMERGKLPLTLAHIMIDNTLWGIQSDRHQYERKNRPGAFTEAQLKEIRKGATLSRLLCDVGDNVYEVPKNAFLIISPENPLVPCSEVPEIDFSAWTDNSCMQR